MSNPLCKCGAPHDGWPGNGDGKLCQMCWEEEAGDAWWEVVGAACPQEVICD